jgi:CheY-like chemotaxis protein
MYLPRAAEGVVAEAAGTGAKAAAAGTVLLVEDNPDVASASTGLLEQLGYAVRWVPDAEAALREIEDNGFDLVFSDIVMPGRMDGLGLARVIRERYPGLPVLLATGYSEAVRNVSPDFPILRKPYRVDQLSRALAGLAEGFTGG